MVPGSTELLPIAREVRYILALLLITYYLLLDPPCRQGREAPIDTTEHKTFRKERSHVIARH